MTLQAEMDSSKDALLSDICISTSSAPTYLPAYNFRTHDSDGNERGFHLVDGGVAANNPVRMSTQIKIYRQIFSWVFGLTQHNIYITDGCDV